MKWKSLPYWLKWGILGALIVLIIGIVLLFLTFNCYLIKGKSCREIYDKNNEATKDELGICYYENFKDCKIFSEPLFYMGRFPFLFFAEDLDIDYTANFPALIMLNIFELLDFIVTGFFIGALLGSLYKKIKYRK